MSDEACEGSCVCGAVAYIVEGPYLAFQYCHCTRCRKASGASHAANLLVKTAQLDWVRGEGTVQRYELPDAKYWSHCFCATCGSAVPWLSRTGKAYIVPAGGLDGDPGSRPTRNIYWESRADWYVHAHELDTFDTYPSRS